MNIGRMAALGGRVSEAATANQAQAQVLAAQQIAMAQQFQKMRDEEALRNAGQAMYDAAGWYEPGVAPQVDMISTAPNLAGAAAPAAGTPGTPSGTMPQKGAKAAGGIRSQEGAKVYQQRLDDVTAQINALQARQPQASDNLFLQLNPEWRAVGEGIKRAWGRATGTEFGQRRMADQGRDISAQDPQAAKLAELRRQQEAYQRGLNFSRETVPQVTTPTPVVPIPQPAGQAQAAPQTLQGVLFQLQGTPVGGQIRLADFQLQQLQRQFEALRPYASNPQVAQQALLLQAQGLQLQTGKMQLMTNAALSQLSFSGDPTAAIQAFAMQGVPLNVQRMENGQMVLLNGQGQRVSAPLYPAQLADYLRQQSDATLLAKAQEHQQALQLEILKAQGKVAAAETTGQYGLLQEQIRSRPLGSMIGATGESVPVWIQGGQVQTVTPPRTSPPRGESKTPVPVPARVTPLGGPAINNAPGQGWVYFDPSTIQQE